MTACCCLGDLISRCATPVIVTREGTGSWANGRYVEGTEETSEVCDVSWQPMSPKDRELLPEAIRTKELLLGFSKTKLRTTDVNLGTKADRFTYKDEVYVVDSVEDWFDHGGFYRIVAEKANDGGI